jgi:hypothetical protein
MFFVPGELIALLTFPGVIVHEAAHQLFCRFFRVAVHDVCYFRVGNPAGYVVHEQSAAPSHQVWISLGPFLLNTLLGALIAAPAAIPVMQVDVGGPLDCLLIWLGVSIAMHAFPSTVDAELIWDTLETRQTSRLTKFIGVPAIGAICLASVGRFVWLDLLYGLAVAMLLPKLAIWLTV